MHSDRHHELREFSQVAGGSRDSWITAVSRCVSRGAVKVNVAALFLGVMRSAFQSFVDYNTL